MKATVYITLIFSALAFQLPAQNISFKPIYPALPTPQIRAEMRSAGVSEMADLNGDGALDVVLLQYQFLNRTASYIYWNDGSGNLSEAGTTVFDTLDVSAMQLVDYDQDGDVDIFTSAYNQSGDRRFQIFENDGSGAFSLQSGPAPGGDITSWEMADLDGDGAPELLAMSKVQADSTSVNLYQNDGSGNFSIIPHGTIIPRSPFSGRNFFIAFADVDNDGDPDLLTTGEHSGSQGTSAKMYQNDGNGQFTLDGANTNVLEDGYGSIIFADLDGSGYQDLLLAVSPNSNSLLHHFENDGNGNFSRKSSSALSSITHVAGIEVADVDGDGALDIQARGAKQTDAATFLFRNDGQGNWSQSADKLRVGNPEAGDINGDGAVDLLLTGGNPSQSNLFINDGSGNFSRTTDNYFPSSYEGKSALVDYDDDGDADYVTTGYGSDGDGQLLFYRNDGQGEFSLDTRNEFNGVESSDFDFADVDNDGDVDFIMNGTWEGEGTATRLMINDGSGVFTEDTITNFNMTREGVVRFADIDNDGDPDVMVTGVTISSIGGPYTGASLYINDGLGNFYHNTSIGGGLTKGDIAFADVNGDGYQDLVYSGYNSFYGNQTRLYLNDGNGVLDFNAGSHQSFPGLERSSILLTDLDADGDPDLVISGRTESSGNLTKLFENDGNGNFSEVIGQNLQEMYWGDIEAIDADMDGLPELLISGTNMGDRYTILYHNKGSLDFQPVSGLAFDQVYRGSVAVADMDGDPDQDVVLTGINDIGLPVAKMYHNSWFNIGVNEHDGPTFDNVHLFPNPSSGTIHIQWSDFEKLSVAIYSLQGQLLDRVEVRDQEELEMALPDPAGMYMVEVRAGGQRLVWKVLKKP